MDEELCKNAIYSNEYYDLILDYIGGYSMGAPECIQQVDNTYDIGFYRRERAPELNLQDYPYLTIPHCLTPMDMTALEVSGMIRLQNPAALDLQGQGVLIGFVDTGINYEHPAFRNVDGSTRILGIWDQTQMEGPPPNGMSYGSVFMGKRRSMPRCRRNSRRALYRSGTKVGMELFWQGLPVEVRMQGQSFPERHRWHRLRL